MQQLLCCWMQAGSLWPAGQPAACMHAVGIGALLTSGFEWSAVCDAYVQRGKVEPAGACMARGRRRRRRCREDDLGRRRRRRRGGWARDRNGTVAFDRWGGGTTPTTGRCTLASRVGCVQEAAAVEGVDRDGAPSLSHAPSAASQPPAPLDVLAALVCLLRLDRNSIRPRHTRGLLAWAIFLARRFSTVRDTLFGSLRLVLICCENCLLARGWWWFDVREK